MEGIRWLIHMISRLIEVFLKRESVFFSGAGFLFWWNSNKIQILLNEGLFLKNIGSRILLDQEDQLQIRLIKILQASNGQHHLVI